MENKSGKREWVKTAAIVFLSILLVLTFFSNTIMNRTLPEVSTEAVASGTITAKVRGSGTVSAIGSNEVKATGTRSIAAVKIKAGQEVNEGDVLFVMGSAADEEVETAKDTYDDLYYALLYAKAGYPTYATSAAASLNDAQIALDRARAEKDAAFNRLVNADPNSELVEASAKVDATSLALSESSKIAAEAQMELDFANADVAVKEAELQEAIASGDEERIRIAQENLDLSLSNQLACEVAFNNAQYDVNINKASYDAAADRFEAMMLSTKSNAQAEYDAAVASCEAAERAYSSAYSSYVSATESYNQSAATYNVGVQQAQHKLDRQEEKIASLTGEGEDANIYAKVGGIVETVDCSVGNTVVKGDLMCTIEVPDQGYTVTITVTKEQAGRLQIGDTADVGSYYWGSSITATVSSIKTDPKNPQSNKLVTFDITGDVTPGQELKIAIGQKSASYDCVVPNSAVMSDSNGKFVLTVESKQSPLGNRYFARRVDVDVLGSDDINSAVNGNIGNGDFVITTSSIHINNGDQVRLSDAG